MLPPQKSIRMTPAGWGALLLSVGVALGVRVVLPLWHPEQFTPTGRNDPRHMAVGMVFVLVPVVFAGLAILLQLLGYPAFRLSEPPTRDPGRGSDASEP